MAAVRDYFVLQKKLLRFSGLSLEENEHVLYRIYSSILCILFIIYLYPLSFDMVVNFNDFDILTDSFYHGAAVLTVLFKYVVVTKNRKTMHATLKVLEQGVFAPKPKRGGPTEEILVEKCVRNLNRLDLGLNQILTCFKLQTVAGWIIAYTSFGIAIVSTIVTRITAKDSRQWRLPFGVFSVLNPTRSPNFEIAWLFQSIMFPLAGAIYVSTDFLILAVFSHVALQFKMLQNSIKRIASGGMDEFQDSNLSKLTWEYLACKLKKTVEYHMAILNLAQHFEDILNMLVLYNYVAALFALACMMYHASLFAPSDPRFQRDGVIMTGLLFETFLTSYFGNEVAEESKMVVLACYEANFVGIDIRLQKALCIIMSRSQKATTFTIGKFADLSLILFMAVVRASVSYYMVLHKLNSAT